MKKSILLLLLLLLLLYYQPFPPKRTPSRSPHLLETSLLQMSHHGLTTGAETIGIKHDLWRPYEVVDPWLMKNWKLNLYHPSMVFFYLHLVDLSSFHVGKYTIHGCYGLYSLYYSSWLNHPFESISIALVKLDHLPKG